MINPALRVGGWGIAAVGYSIASGWEWILEPVTLPLGAVLLLTFVPLGTINRALRRRLDPPEEGS